MRVAWISLLALLAGCASIPRSGSGSESAGPRARFGEEFPLPLGESIPLDGSGYTIVFRKVLEDSRCPVDRTCVWEGNARIEIELKAAVEADSGLVELNTSSRFPTPNAVAGVVFEVRRLEPAPRADTPTQGYVVTLFARKS